MPGFSLAESKNELREQRRQIYREFLFQVQRESFIQDKKEKVWNSPQVQGGEGCPWDSPCLGFMLAAVGVCYRFSQNANYINLSVCEGFPDTLL